MRAATRCVFVKKVSKSKTKLEGKLEGVRTIATRHAACVGRRGRAHEFVCVEGRRGHARVRVSSVSRRGRGLRWSEGGELQSVFVGGRAVARRCGMRHRHVGERVRSTLCNPPRLAAAAAAAAASGASGLLDEKKHAQGGGAVVDLWWCGGGRGESLDLWRPRACLVRTMTMYAY